MSDSIFILFILCLNIVICEWLDKKPGFRHIGTALLVILVTAVEANLVLIPTTKTPVYEGIFSYLAPFSLFLLLLSVNLKDLSKTGLPMLTMFLIGSIGTPNGLAMLLALGFGSIFLTKQLAAWFPTIPFVLILTTVALGLAQFRAINKVRGSWLLGLFGVYIFLAVIGANCDITTSALAVARSLNRPDLQLPAVLVGTLGNAIGTYLGILVAEVLR